MGEQRAKAGGAAECRSCGALIIWTLTKNGKRSPVDAGPSPEGNIRLTRLPGGDGLLATVLAGGALTGARADGDRLHLSHFVTCKQASLHRKPRPATKAGRRCPAKGCPELILPTHVACRRHWLEIPEPVRARIWQLFRTAPGSDEHRAVVFEAVRVLAGAEPKEPK